MIKKTVFFLLVSVCLAGAQPIYPVLVCSNACYTNASIFRTNAAYVLVSYEGGLEKVSITNLPDEMQKSIGYDSAKAAAAISEEQKKIAAHKARLAQEAAQEAYKEQAERKSQTVQIISVYDDFGKCKISGIAPVYSTVIMYDIPESVGDYLADYYQVLQDSTVGKYEEGDMSFNSYKYKSKFSSKDNGFISSSAHSEEGFNKSFKSRLPKLEEHLVQSTTVLAYPLGYAHDGFPVWQCVGVVAPTVPQPEAGISGADKPRDVGEKK